MRIHKNGWSTIVFIWLTGALLITTYAIFIPWKWLSIPLIAITGFLMAFILYFFRVPLRKSGDNNSPLAVTSVADGEVVIIEKVYEPEYFKDERMLVSVYMNFFDVHVNFWPISGKVTYKAYHPGKFFLAFLPKASEFNEHTSIAVRNRYGEVFFKQMAGTFARRIVCKAEVGDNTKRGEQCGLIKFGSRIDMFLPLDAKIKVELGDDVAACLSVIAELPDTPAIS